MRRIALYSDIHGNIAALDAVLADIEASGIDEVYCLGDLVGYGPHPSEVIARVAETGHPTIRGNYDDGVGNRKGNCGCYYPDDQAKADGAASYTFTNKLLTDEEHAWLAALPDDITVDIEGVRVLLCHGSPRRINEYLLLDRPADHLARLAEEADVDVVCVGHVHIPYHRVVPGPFGPVHYVSDGSVGKPKGRDPKSCWAELAFGARDEVRAVAPGDGHAGSVGFGDTWLAVRFHRVDYDVETVAREMIDAGLPATLAEALRAE